MTACWLICSELLVVVCDSRRGLSNGHQIQHDSLLRATVRQEGLFADSGHVFAREAGGFFDVIQISASLSP